MITPEDGVGYEWTDKHGDKWITTQCEDPTICVTLSTFRGGLGGIHWYARIRATTPKLFDIAEQKVYTCGGYGDDAPTFYEYTIDAEREMDEPEFDEGGDEIGYDGVTSRHNTPEQAMEATVNTLKKEFCDGPSVKWVVKFDSWGDVLQKKEFFLHELDTEILSSQIEVYDEYL